MSLFNILALVYLCLIIADDVTAWGFNAFIKRKISGYDAEYLPKAVQRRVVKLHSTKQTTRTVIRILQIALLIPIAAAVLVAVGTVIINF